MILCRKIAVYSAIALNKSTELHDTERVETVFEYNSQMQRIQLSLQKFFLEYLVQFNISTSCKYLTGKYMIQ